MELLLYCIVSVFSLPNLVFLITQVNTSNPALINQLKIHPIVIYPEHLEIW